MPPPDKTIDELATAATLTGAEILYAIQSGSDVQLTVGDIVTLAQQIGYTSGTDRLTYVGPTTFYNETGSGITYLLVGQPPSNAANWKEIGDLVIDWADITNKPDLSVYAPLASPAFTGTPTAPTAAPGTDTTQLATTAFVNAAVLAGGGGGVVVARNDVTPTAPVVSGDQSVAGGYGATAGVSSASFGDGAASGDEAVSFGTYSVADNNGVAAGMFSLTSKEHSVSVGYDANTLGAGVVSVGSGTRASYDGSIVIGRNSEGAQATPTGPDGNGVVIGYNINAAFMGVPGLIAIGSLTGDTPTFPVLDGGLNLNGYGVGTPQPDAFQFYDASAVGLPRMSTAQRVALVPGTRALVVYDTTTQRVMRYNPNTATWNPVTTDNLANAALSEVRIINTNESITDADQGKILEVTGAVTLTVGALSANFQQCLVRMMDTSVATFNGTFTASDGSVNTVNTASAKYFTYMVERMSNGDIFILLGA